MIGQTLAHYNILEKVGEGGMGIVYRARDLRLERFVAMKFLHPTGLETSDEKKRLLREAQSAASLSHPNICTVYGLEEIEGRQCLVMEFIDGLPLLQSARSLPPARLFDVAIQIADGLAAAHEKGITHRDVKPENILLRRDGLVQIMDFGIATPRGDGSIPLSDSRLGTAKYMSPEQVNGGSTDFRSDIFSFGIVLYELFTGRYPFRGLHESALMYEIVHSDVPPPTSARPELPENLDELIRGCLEKDPRDRLQSAAEASRLLRKIRKSEAARPRPPASASVITAHPGKEQTRSYWRSLARDFRVLRALAGLFFFGLISIGALHFSEERQDPLVVRFQLVPDDSLSIQSAALSPDGSRLAFTTPMRGTTMLSIRELRSLKPLIIEGTEGADAPFWSFDSRQVAFFAGGMLKRVEISGGSPFVICEAPNGRGGTWNQFGDILFAPRTSGVIHRVPAAGGIPEPVTSLDSSLREVQHVWPSFLPDGRHFIFSSRSRDRGESTVRFASLGSQAARTILTSEGHARFAPPGILLFVNNRTVLAQRFDAETGTISGDRHTVLDDVDVNPATGLSSFTVSSNGVLASYGGRSRRRRIVWVDREGRAIDSVGPPGDYHGLALAPDGRRAAIVSADPISGNSDIWTIDLERRLMTRFTFDPAAEENPVWSPDGSTIAYSASTQAGPSRVIIRDARNGGGERAIDVSGRPSDWSRDGKYLLLNDRAKGDMLFTRTDSAGDATPLVELSAEARYGHFSPDGRYVAYASNESGRFEVYIRTFPASGGRWQVSTNGGTQPRWRRDGKELFFVGMDQVLQSVRLTTRNGLELGTPDPLFEMFAGDISSDNSYEVAGDGRRFLVNVPAEADNRASATIIVHWVEEVAPLLFDL